MSRIYRQFRDHVATVKMSRNEFRRVKLAEVVDAVEINKDDAEKLLGTISSKIDRLKTYETRIAVASLVASILLFASLYGVEFEIEFLGITLKGLQKLKEIIFCGIAASGLFVAALNGTSNHLKEIRKRLFVRIYGAAAYEIHAPTFNDYVSYDFDIPLGPTRYFPTASTLVLEGFRIFVEFLPLFVAIAASLFVTIFIAFDIWANSNLPEPWGKVLSGVVYVGWAVQLFLTGLSHVWKFSFIDAEKLKEAKVSDPETGELHPVAKKLIDRSVFIRGLRQTILDRTTAVLVAAAMVYSAGRFDEISAYVQKVLGVQ